MDPADESGAGGVMTYGKRPIRCGNCGSWIIRVYSAQAVCCLHDGPRWADDAQAYEDYVEYKTWFDRLPSEDKS